MVSRVSVVAVLACVSAVLCSPAQAADDQSQPPAHSITVTGTGVATYPAFDRDVERYAVTTVPSTGGTITVDASTEDPDGLVRVDGRPADGPTTVSGLEAGEEVSVVFEDSGGVDEHALVYLPADFPALAATSAPTATTGPQVALTLFVHDGTRVGTYEAVVDRHGVPAYVRSAPSQDLRQQPDGHWTAVRADAVGNGLVELDASFRELRSLPAHRTAGTLWEPNLLLPGGNVVYVGTRRSATTYGYDTVLQERTPKGEVVLEWSSEEHTGDALTGPQHRTGLQNLQLTPDGHLLASLREFSAVYKIARRAGDGHAAGDVMWRLGGSGGLTLVDDPFPGGPCAPREARQLADGHVLVFDSGSSQDDLDLRQSMCRDSEAGLVDRPTTRVTEYAVDEAAGTATLVRSWELPGHVRDRDGAAWQTADGNVLTFWTAEDGRFVREVAPGGAVLWELALADGDPHRSVVTSVAPAHTADLLDPEISLHLPEGASFAQGETLTADYRCTDAGGSTLRTCKGSVMPGEPLDTSRVGTHTVTVTATDGAGNTATVARRYHVRPALAPNASLRSLPGGSWVGDQLRGGPRGQVVRRVVSSRSRVVGALRVVNEGLRAGRFRVDGDRGGRGLSVRYLVGRRDVTDAVVAGTFRTPRLAPGQRFGLRVQVTRRGRQGHGHARTLTVRVTPDAATGPVDTVGLRVRARR